MSVNILVVFILTCDVVDLRLVILHSRNVVFD